MSRHLLDITQFPQYQQLKDSFYAINQDLSKLSHDYLIAKSFDIYNHYRHNPNSKIDPAKITKPISWRGLFLYHSSNGWSAESNEWPMLKNHLLSVTNLVSVQVNFVAPNSIIPMHRDLSNGISCITTILAVQVNPNSQFILEDEIVFLKNQDLIALDGVNVSHEIRNLSDSWRITLAIDIANDHPSLVER
jgi:hypothetical protein